MRICWNLLIFICLCKFIYIHGQICVCLHSFLHDRWRDHAREQHRLGFSFLFLDGRFITVAVDLSAVGLLCNVLEICNLLPRCPAFLKSRCKREKFSSVRLNGMMARSH